MMNWYSRNNNYIFPHPAGFGNDEESAAGFSPVVARNNNAAFFQHFFISHYRCTSPIFLIIRKIYFSSYADFLGDFFNLVVKTSRAAMDPKTITIKRSDFFKKHTLCDFISVA